MISISLTKSRDKKEKKTNAFFTSYFPYLDKTR